MLGAVASLELRGGQGSAVVRQREWLPVLARNQADSRGGRQAIE